jgi:hypothetical protein
LSIALHIPIYLFIGHYGRKPTNTESKNDLQMDSDTGLQCTVPLILPQSYLLMSACIEKKTKTGGDHQLLSTDSLRTKDALHHVNKLNATPERSERTMGDIFNDNGPACSSPSEMMVDLGGDSSPPNHPISSHSQLDALRQGVSATDRRILLKVKLHIKY